MESFCQRFNIPLTRDQIKTVPYYRPAQDTPEMKYMRARRDALGGVLPSRRNDFESLKTPTLDSLAGQLKSSGKREISTMNYIFVNV